MKKGRFLLVVGLFLSLGLSAQSTYVFKVLANKGSNEYKSGDTWQAVKTGISLNDGDELKVSENSYLALVHKNGKPVELKKAGPYKVTELAAKMGGEVSLLNKYTDFVLSSNSAEAKKNRLSATGAVHRDVPQAGAVTVYLPEAQNASIYGSSMMVIWEAPKAGGPYVVTVKNIFEDDLAKFETPETSIKLDLSDPKFASETALLINVSCKADSKIKSENKVVKKLAPAELDRIKKEYASISGDVTEESALNKFIMGGFFEQNGLLIDALRSYEDAMMMAPDVEYYKEGRDEFLYRNKLAAPKQ